MKFIFLIFAYFLLSCSAQNINSYKDEKPQFVMENFFKGKLSAHGIVQDRKGVVIKRFKVFMTASWENEHGLIDEKFLYSDGTKSERVWKMNRISPLHYEGRASDVIGVALGEVSGNTFHFNYELLVPVEDKTYQLRFDDWMYLVDEKTLMAKSEMTKWGFHLGDVTIVMKKEE